MLSKVGFLHESALIDAVCTAIEEKLLGSNIRCASSSLRLSGVIFNLPLSQRPGAVWPYRGNGVVRVTTSESQADLHLATSMRHESPYRSPENNPIPCVKEKTPERNPMFSVTGTDLKSALCSMSQANPYREPYGHCHRRTFSKQPPCDQKLHDRSK